MNTLPVRYWDRKSKRMIYPEDIESIDMRETGGEIFHLFLKDGTSVLVDCGVEAMLQTTMMDSQARRLWVGDIVLIDGCTPEHYWVIELSTWRNEYDPLDVVFRRLCDNKVSESMKVGLCVGNVHEHSHLLPGGKSP